jgi:hypothetical protein
VRKSWLRTSRPLSTDSDVAAFFLSDTILARLSADWFTLTPIPAIPVSNPSKLTSAPDNLRSPTYTSLGHLTMASTPQTNLAAVATATPHAKLSCIMVSTLALTWSALTCHTNDMYTLPSPAADFQSRLRRPTPAVCSSAAITKPWAAAPPRALTTSSACAAPDCVCDCASTLCWRV